jgi:hypothetical protein
MPIILATQEAEIRRISVQNRPGQIVHETLSQKHSIQKMASGVAQVIECLASKHETLSSSPTTAKKEKNRKEEREESYLLKAIAT